MPLQTASPTKHTNPAPSHSFTPFTLPSTPSLLSSWYHPSQYPSSLSPSLSSAGVPTQSVPTYPTLQLAILLSLPSVKPTFSLVLSHIIYTKLVHFCDITSSIFMALSCSLLSAHGSPFVPRPLGPDPGYNEGMGRMEADWRNVAQ